MTDTENASTTPQAEADKPKTIWDNDLPAGDSPPLPRWPLTAAIVAFGVWIVFMIAMMIMSITYTG